MWKKTVRKQRKQMGLSYTSVSGKKVAAKQMQEKTITVSLNDCREQFSDADREGYFKSFWNLKSCERQKDFICDNVTEEYRGRRRSKARRRRRCSRSYKASV